MRTGRDSAIALICGVALSMATASQAADVKRSALGPMTLTDAQMDEVTAGVTVSAKGSAKGSANVRVSPDEVRQVFTLVLTLNPKVNEAVRKYLTQNPQVLQEYPQLKRLLPPLPPKPQPPVGAAVPVVYNPPSNFPAPSNAAPPPSRPLQQATAILPK